MKQTLRALVLALGLICSASISAYAAEELTAEIELSAEAITAGQTVTLSAYVEGGTEPYTYEWFDQMNNTLGTTDEITVNPSITAGYLLIVTDADGQTVTATAAVAVRGDLVPATFDDNFLPAGGHRMPTQYGEVFTSGSFVFHCGAFAEYDYWFGYTTSSDTGTTFTSLADQFRSRIGGHNSINYAIAFPEGQLIDITNNADGDIVTGMYITNAAYSYNSIANGDGYDTPFTTGDFFKVIATGTKADRTRVTSEFYLADMRSDNPDEQFIVDDWQWWDLSSLGQIKTLTFSFDGSRKNTWGLTTPAYFAFDDLGGEAPVTALSDTRTAKTIASVSYSNLAGQVSDTPFNGVNIVITRYTDGTTATAKMIKVGSINCSSRVGD